MRSLGAVPRPVVILGVPRSGTTWVHEVLGACTGVRSVAEPDNETNRPWPLVAKARLGRFPLLSPGEEAPRYERLWRAACGGAPFKQRAAWCWGWQQRWVGFDSAEAACDPERGLGLAPRAVAWLGRPARVHAALDGPVIVKSVHAALCARWLASLIRPAILVVLRDPFEVAASWRAMSLRRDGASERMEYAAQPERILSPAALEHLCASYGSTPSTPDRALVWLAAGLMSELRAFAATCDEAIVLDFDEACLSPHRTLSAIAERLGLRWSAGSVGTLAAHNKPGEGWETNRLTAQVPGIWRRRLDPAVIARLDAELGRFELLSGSPRTQPPPAPPGS